MNSKERKARDRGRKQGYLKATDRCRKDHDGIAEALLIAEYGRRHYNGKS